MLSLIRYWSNNKNKNIKISKGHIQKIITEKIKGSIKLKRRRWFSVARGLKRNFVDCIRTFFTVY